MSNERKRIHYDEGDFDIVVGVDHVTIAGAVAGYTGIICVNDAVMIHRLLLAQIMVWVDSEEGRDALELPRVMRKEKWG